MPSLTVENYVKAIYQLCQTHGRLASTGELAEHLAVSPGTVTSMLKTLAEAELASYVPYEGVQLTATGQALALRVVRRHRLIELFLVRTLNLNWDEVHAEAEHMEHAVSDLLVDRIDAFLGFPKSDPHGDPIPTAAGQLDTPAGQRLADCATNETFTLLRVLDQTPEFLRFLTEVGLTLGVSGKVVAQRAEAGTVTITVEQNPPTTLGRPAAERLLVCAGTRHCPPQAPLANDC